ncbi:hypothetical protein C7Q39_11955 [Staphylococcus aureus]|uniref:hypothetical protein n=1 Tax=Staphylococcus aureus TaxID=1280 RepID=UPI000DAAB886|nr:hypothetical protein [Staphylococcus aureus]MBZ5278089.1 hypothetical protein [Staphylococcus aureus]PZK94971.1 hypothetical protein C7Q39_11955 [Staphylococcus aureus]HCT3180767.1 hypothetical protein [Staphylococcus aureus]
MIETQYNDSDVELELGYRGKVYLSYIPLYEFEDFLDGKYPNTIKIGNKIEDIIDVYVNEFDYIKTLNLINPLVINTKIEE